jgi:hypothetical protein
MESRGSREDRLWSRVGRNTWLGAGLGAVFGLVVGALLGAVAFERLAATLVAAGVGALGFAVVGAFAGVLAGLESPEPGEEPSSVERPVGDVPELASEQHPPER